MGHDATKTTSGDLSDIRWEYLKEMDRIMAERWNEAVKQMYSEMFSSAAKSAVARTPRVDKRPWYRKNFEKTRW